MLTSTPLLCLGLWNGDYPGLERRETLRLAQGRLWATRQPPNCMIKHSGMQTGHRPAAAVKLSLLRKFLVCCNIPK